MSDLIDRQAAIDALGEKPLVWDDLSDFDLGKAAQWSDDVDAIKELPSAQPEIVRCKDCVHYDLAKNGYNGQCNRQYAVFTAYDFCSYGERRGDEE